MAVLISDVGYALNSLGYLVLLLLLFTVRKAGLAKHLLVLASLTTLGWSLGFITVIFGPVTLTYLLIADTIKTLVWLLFIASCLRNDFTDLWQVLRRPATLMILSIPTLVLLITASGSVAPNTQLLLMTVLALEVLILLEVLYRQTGADKWAYKPLVLYLGATHLFEFVTFANSTMINQIEIGYVAARGYIYVLLLPLLIVAIRRIKHWGVDIFISRDVVLHSSLLLVAGGYLTVMALIGYVVNLVGGSWGTTVQIVLFALSLVLLASVFMSNSFRTQIKVFITKHFFANLYDYRLEWVKLTKALSSTSSEAQDVYQNALAGILGAINYDTGRLVKWVNRDVETVAVVDAPPLTKDEVAIVKELKEYCARTSWLIDVDEYAIKPFNYEGLSLDRQQLKKCTFQLVLPIFREESIWGFALLNVKENERVRLDWEVRDYLNAVTEQVGTFVFHFEAARAVAENAQFAAFNRMSAFVLHDLKNVMAQIDLILCNAEQHKDNPEFIEDTFETLHYTKARMDKMLRQLTEKKIEEPGIDSAHKLSDIAAKVVEARCQAIKPLPSITVSSEELVVVDEEKVANVIYHLVSNAQQATPDEGKVELNLAFDEAGQWQRLTITDTGSGMDEAFINNRLFKPFDTTKGNAGMGIGAYDAKTYMESIGGKLTVSSEPGRGSCFTLMFPTD